MDLSESAFETYIYHHLVDTHHYLLRPTTAFDPSDCLDWELVVEFITASQPDAWRALQHQHGSDTVKKFRHRLSSEISRVGTLEVLRKGIRDSGVGFSLAYFQPASTLNPEHWTLYQKNIFSVISQCHYSDAYPSESIDLVLFVNGLPIFTLELKNKQTGQNVFNAREQYKNDRSPQKGVLLSFKRCLAHFAVDDDEVFMTTRLDGVNTRFLPFNKGNAGGAGNPINPDGYASSYLWEGLFSPVSIMELLGSFVHLEEFKKDRKTVENLIFPRYHQRDAVQKMIAHAKSFGPGQHYLIQHSAGSGKSNTISWLAHRLSSLHSDQNKRIFDSVIVITDRRVLDRQLQRTVSQFEQVPGIVSVIDQDSTQLANSLQRGDDIIVTTLQKFPFVVEKLDSLAGHNFAIIVDEAHSSQSGEASASLRQTLSASTLEEAEQEESGHVPDTDEDLVNRRMALRGRQPNLSFFAFTATPKSKTLELFGTQKEDGSFEPFHLYSMRQAIEEQFILDVLENYTTFNVYFNILKTAEEDPRVIKSKAVGILKRYVSLHEFSIERLLALMVEHFMSTTINKIPDANGVGQAKAMIVTRSRLHAVRYKLAIDNYLKDQKYPVKALVAFSGIVPDGGKDYTESQMNGFPESQTANKFNQPEYRFLIVAEKFQTGFDQPLLHTMYVDKVLQGVNAVQTLSRLNRIHARKSDTMVLDFANRQEDILKSFQPYYEQTTLREGSDPNLLYNYQSDLQDFHIYTPLEVQDIADLFLKKGEKAASLQPLIRTIVDRYRSIPEQERRIEFQRLIHLYISMYGFLSQVINFQDASLERLYIFSRLLVRDLPQETTRQPVDIQKLIDLESFRIQQTSSGSLKPVKGKGVLVPMNFANIELTDPEKEALSKIIKEINERFGTEFSDQDRVFFAELKSRLAANPALQNSARSNDKENVQLFYDALFEQVLREMIDKNFDLFKRINDNEDFGNLVRKLVFEQVYNDLMDHIKPPAS